MKAYKWQLLKGSVKDVCPSCGQKRFVPFVLSADNETRAGAEYGRCDREQECGYFRYPGGEVTEVEKPIEKPPLPIFTFPLYNKFSTMYENNSLLQAYKHLIDWDKLKAAFDMYKCSTAGYSIIYPQYDGEVVRTAKYIRYDKTGHRMKDWNVKWEHKIRYNLSDPRRLEQCLFGQHLLKEYPDREVMIVEAEKTALLMSATDKNADKHIWLACGGSQMLKGAINLNCLIGRIVTLIPDDGQLWNWQRTAAVYGWECMDISKFNRYDLPAGYDIWDIKEKQLYEKK